MDSVWIRDTMELITTNTSVVVQSESVYAQVDNTLASNQLWTQQRMDTIMELITTNTSVVVQSESVYAQVDNTLASNQLRTQQRMDT
ncbi:hypothetical protein J6590_101812 [Homalodisca vitripennis]|nr:hypothetical protein J6590_101812 [Homalodisca vitripennis]